MKFKLPVFATQKELIAYLVKNKKELIEMKKAAYPMKYTDQFGSEAHEQLANKALNTHYQDDPASGIIKRTIIGNTYNWMDSHGDVHLDGLFEKSIKERKEKIFHLHDHEYKITSKVGTPSAIYEKTVAWSDLGVNYPGKTMALMVDSSIKEGMNPQIFKGYLSNEINQHSVGMIYVKIDLAVNDPEQKTEYAQWTKVIDRIANKDKAIKQGYFWPVSEAKLIEISAVLEGSNELTPTVENTDKLPPIETPKAAINYSYLASRL